VNDTEALQRTVRRIGAILVAVLSRIGYEVTEFGGLWTLLVGGGAVCYLFVSLFVQYVDTAAPSQTPAGQRDD
jgi:hypothetical protein